MFFVQSNKLTEVEIGNMPVTFLTNQIRIFFNLSRLFLSVSMKGRVKKIRAIVAAADVI